ncbi:MAG: glycosyltransferase family 2 protein [bacterium]|nr:glycosyltransferase family 2 protein [bacterium]
MDLSVVIVNFNTPQLLRLCLASLEKCRGETEFEVVVVNTTPTDGSKEILEKEFPWVKQLVRENRGFSANNNQAISETTGKYVLFLNSDTTVPQGTLSALVKFMEDHSEVGVVTPYVEIASTGQFDPDTSRRTPTPWSAFWQLFAKVGIGGYHQKVDFSKPSEIEATSGAAMLVRRTAADQIGWWDERFFFYGEDLDWGFRFRQAGWKIVLYPQVKIIHHKGASSGLKKESSAVTTASKETRRKMAAASTQAMRLFYQKHYAAKYPSIFNRLIYFSIWLLEKIRLVKS